MYIFKKFKFFSRGFIAKRRIFLIKNKKFLMKPRNWHRHERVSENEIKRGPQRRARCQNKIIIPLLITKDMAKWEKKSNFIAIKNKSLLFDLGLHTCVLSSNNNNNFSPTKSSSWYALSRGSNERRKSRVNLKCMYMNKIIYINYAWDE